MATEKIKYINDKPEQGIMYDWKLIRKCTKQLEIPSEYYSPALAPLDGAAWFVGLSERATGKTTGWLLLGLVMYQLYGTVTLYVRGRKDMIAPKNAGSLFNIINENRYVEKITHNKYNSTFYKSRRWYLAHVDKNGVVDNIDPSYFCRMVSVQENADLKSSLNEPTGDLVIFDEFIDTSPRFRDPNEFVNFVDLVSTIFRMRVCGKIVMLANTIDKYNQYFHDLEIFERLSTMDIGQRELVTTDRGTKIHVEIIGAPTAYRKKKNRWVERFAGFRKPELAAITGETLWAVHNYQHIPYVDSDDKKPETISNRLYVQQNNKIVRLEIVDNPELGICIYAHWATKTYNDSIILTHEPRYDKRYITDIDSKSGKFIRAMNAAGRIYFASNDVGSFLETFFTIKFNSFSL